MDRRRTNEPNHLCPRRACDHGQHPKARYANMNQRLEHRPAPGGGQKSAEAVFRKRFPGRKFAIEMVHHHANENQPEAADDGLPVRLRRPHFFNMPEKR